MNAFLEAVRRGGVPGCATEDRLARALSVEVRRISELMAGATPDTRATYCETLLQLAAVPWDDRQPILNRIERALTGGEEGE